MNKVAAYLNEHVAGEVLTADAALSAAQTDGSVLLRRPEMVVRASSVNDIRKIMRFCSQLAEKGHVMPVSVRGHGTDTTGAATGTGIMIELAPYMNRVAGLDVKQRLIHVQAGISLAAVEAVLSTHKGLGLPTGSTVRPQGTVGGAIGSGIAGWQAGRCAPFGQAVQQLEVVLSNGEVLQTGRLSKRELHKKKGLANFEGEIYRQVDNLITDNAELLAQLDPEVPETAGYAGIAKVKRRDGSFDLTPLFIGAQGGLGIISEVILKADFVRPEVTAVVAAYGTVEDAQAAAEIAVQLPAASVDIVDGRLFERAAQGGKKLSWAPKKAFRGAVLLVVFDDFSVRTRTKLAKKLIKRLPGEPLETEVMTMELSEEQGIYAAVSLAAQPAAPQMAVPATFSGLWLPANRMSVVRAELKRLEKEFSIELPYVMSLKSGFVDILPLFSTNRVSDRQKLLKLLAELTGIVMAHGGTMAGRGGDGRLKAGMIRARLSDEERQLHDDIKHIFDPSGLFSPGSKHDVEAKQLVAEVNAWCRAA